MEIIIKKDAQQASYAAARVVARVVREKPRAVIGLATGSTPLMLYRELVRMHREEGLDFSRITTFTCYYLFIRLFPRIKYNQQPADNTVINKITLRTRTRASRD